MTAKAVFYHRGLAEALQVHETVLENMTMRELAERAFEMGGELTVGEGGNGPGLTLRAATPAALQSEEASGEHRD